MLYTLVYIFASQNCYINLLYCNIFWHIVIRIHEMKFEISVCLFRMPYILLYYFWRNG